jgi:hypothetical protein
LGKLAEAAIIQQKVEILSALKKLGEEVGFLTAEDNVPAERSRGSFLASA